MVPQHSEILPGYIPIGIQSNHVTLPDLYLPAAFLALTPHSHPSDLVDRAHPVQNVTLQAAHAEICEPAQIYLVPDPRDQDMKNVKFSKT